MGKVDSKPKFTDSHYNFSYKLKEGDIKKGEVKIDPYFVANQWELGAKDNTGCLFHLFKTICRFGIKNTEERELKAMKATLKRMFELKGVDFDEK